jgi:hypothetical protein
MEHGGHQAGEARAGMVVLDAAVRGVLALAGLRYPARHPELVALEMAVAMTAGIVA